MIKVDIKEALKFLKNKPESLQEKIEKIHFDMHEYKSIGSNFLGWLELPINYDKEEYQKMILAANKIKKQSKVFVVIGIGGSYLGAKAGLEFLTVPFKKEEVSIVFAGHQLSGTYLTHLLEYLEDKDYSINVISKSGTTTEPAVAFRILKKAIEDKYGKEGAKNRIFATTDAKRGALYTLAKKEGYEMFVIPDNVGGRFSVLTAVGLLPFMVAGLNTDQMLKGAKDAYLEYANPSIDKNAAYLYAATRYLLSKEGKSVEILASYEPCMGYLQEWWKQLYGESEGKDHKGLFVASVNFTTDLHSMGQYIQDGQRIIFETIMKINEFSSDIAIPYDEEDLDGLNYIEGKKLSYVNEQALKGTLKAHVNGLVPNILIEIPKADEYNFGYLIYFFEKACAISAYLLEVNPFNQPGVEEYKKNMFALLGKKGY